MSFCVVKKRGKSQKQTETLNNEAAISESFHDKQQKIECKRKETSNK